MVHKVKLVSSSLPNPLKNWAVVFNPDKPNAEALANEVAQTIRRLGGVAQIHSNKKAPTCTGIDAIATVGGDGTLLGCVEGAVGAGIPIVGINIGKLGYLTRINPDKIDKAFAAIFAGNYRTMERELINVTLKNGEVHYALNDVVIKSADFRLAELSISVDGEAVASYNCDGLILATPTGSTAYNLSAGGPILHQSIEGLVLTPICPHSLRSRSVVFNSHSQIEVAPSPERSRVHINVDGRAVADGEDVLPIRVREANRKLVTIEDPEDCGTFSVLKEKMGW